MDRLDFANVMGRLSAALKKKGGQEALASATGLLAGEAESPSDEGIRSLLDRNAPKFEPFFLKKGWWPLSDAPVAPASLTDEQILQMLYKEIDIVAAEMRAEAA